ncbi:MAG: class I SAM-dependent methyltransferase [Verrucomicrobia bacterium]|nr:class I SAM-dependent methyltransferase [Verrucomicrobiota bacterium]
MNKNAVLFLLGARMQGINFDRCLTLGRLQINVYRKPLRALLQRAGVLDESLFAQIPTDGSVPYADPFLRMLGARDLHVMDYSDYEGADVLQDLNTPVPETLKQKFDVVFDGGTLEHVFNFPVALRNCMDMVAVGGSLFFHLPANNNCGHGFYQFGPDVFYRALSPENGFEVRRMIIHADGPYNRWYQVADPQVVRQRVELITFRPMYLLVHAVKTRDVGTAWQRPQQTTYEQTDYASMRNANAALSDSGSAARRAALVDRFPAIAQLLRVLKHGVQFYTSHALMNRRIYQPVPKLPR